MGTAGCGGRGWDGAVDGAVVGPGMVKASVERPPPRWSSLLRCHHGPCARRRLFRPDPPPSTHGLDGYTPPPCCGRHRPPAPRHGCSCGSCNDGCCLLSVWRCCSFCCGCGRCCCERRRAWCRTCGGAASAGDPAAPRRQGGLRRWQLQPLGQRPSARDQPGTAHPRLLRRPNPHPHFLPQPRHQQERPQLPERRAARGGHRDQHLHFPGLGGGFLHGWAGHPAQSGLQGRKPCSVLGAPPDARPGPGLGWATMPAIGAMDFDQIFVLRYTRPGVPPKWKA